jgi:hypothetical protein
MWQRRVWVNHVDRVPIAMVGMGDSLAGNAFAFGPCRDGEATDGRRGDSAGVILGKGAGHKLRSW